MPVRRARAKRPDSGRDSGATSAVKVEMSVEICVDTPNFRGFRKTSGCMMIFQEASPYPDQQMILCRHQRPSASGRKMKQNQRRFFRLGFSMLGALILSPALLGQTAADREATGPVMSDWTQHHVIFSQPATREQAQRVEQDVRYWQQLRRQTPANLAGPETGALASELQPGADARPADRNLKLGADWAEDLGTGGSVGATNYPAKFSFLLTVANCATAAQPDFAVYGTGLAGSATQASIAAFDNLYSGCTGTVPLVYWAVNTAGGKVTTSPVFSSDGSQIAFVQADGSGNGNLVLLRWAASTTESIGSPATLVRLPNTSYPGCTAPCMTSTVLTDASSTPHPDTRSSVFYDYNSDTAYVGDDGGWLHQFHPVFNGIPSEVRAAGWPVRVSLVNPTPLTSPVFDQVSGRVFVADVGGFAYRVGPNTAFVATSSGPLDVSSAEGGIGIVQGPVVDSTAEAVYVFSSADGSAGCIGGADCTAVFTLPVNFASGATGTKTVVGASTKFGTAVPKPMYIGAFDAAYQNSVNASGNLYVCGNTGGPPILYQVGVTAGALGTVLPGPVLSNSTTPCSPVTDVFNPNNPGGATEWVYASVRANGTSANAGTFLVPKVCAPTGCITNFKDTPWIASHAYVVGQEVLDTHLQIQAVMTAGTSGGTTPVWSTTKGSTTTDGGVTWLNQGVLSAFTAAWAPNTFYAPGAEVFDSNGNVELETKSPGATSGPTPPVWPTAVGGTVNETAGGPHWLNVGPIATYGLKATGGTSGMVIDNMVETLAGASQIYFSTLSDQVCGTSGTGGCAVQVSQSILK